MLISWSKENNGIRYSKHFKQDIEIIPHTNTNNTYTHTQVSFNI